MEIDLAQKTMQFHDVTALGVLRQQRLSALLNSIVIALRVLDLHDVVRNRLGVYRFVLQRTKCGQCLVVFLHLVHAVRVVIRSAGGVTAVSFAQLGEIDRSALVLLHHQISITAIERVILLMGACESLQVDLLQDFESLLIVPFLNLQDSLHEMHFVFEGGVRVCLQVRFEVALQEFVASLKASR